jgi:hypothetical protein
VGLEMGIDIPVLTSGKRGRMMLFLGPLSFIFKLASTVLIGPWPSLMDFSIHRHLVGLLGWGISPTQRASFTLDFSLLHRVQTGSGAHPASYLMS